MSLQEIVLVRGNGQFAHAVVFGARRRAEELGLATREVDLGEWSIADRLLASAVLIVGSFAEDLSIVVWVRAECEPGLVGCVAAGLHEFADRLGGVADGVVGPVQWIPQGAKPEIGLSGVEFAQRYRAKFRMAPGYVAAQSAAAGFLAYEAHRRGYTAYEIRHWTTTSLLGTFTLDKSWRQVGHSTITVRWHDGRQVPAS
jgi:hypothetical protein